MSAVDALRWRRPVAGLLLGLATAAAVAAPVSPASAEGSERFADALSASEQRGRAIFVRGASPSGAEIAAVVAGGTIVAGSVMPCGSCHGRDGRGRAEGGVSPSNITWDELTKAYGAAGSSGRVHPPYDERALKKAVALGLDPAGNELNPTMPRYRMSQEDMADLIAFIKRLGHEPVPGATATTLVIGTLLPEGDGGTVTEALLRAAFTEVNRRGGLFGRRLELAAHRLATDPSARRASVARFLDETPVFALVAPSLAGAEAEISALLEEREVPAIGAVGAIARGAEGEASFGRQVFHQISTLEDQARALIVRFAGEGASAVRPTLGIVGSNGAEFAPLVDAALDEAERRGYEPKVVLRYPAARIAASGLAADLAGAKVDALVFFGPAGDQAALLRALAARGRRPRTLALGAWAGRELFDLPADVASEVRLAFPIRPIDPTADGAGEWRALATAHRLEPKELAVQAAVLTGAKLLVAGLERAGRELSRDKLITAVESFHLYDSGVMPPLRFGPGRRRGARGAYLVELDLAQRGFKPDGDWIEVN